jgi:hypothetical protein
MPDLTPTTFSVEDSILKKDTYSGRKMKRNIFYSWQSDLPNSTNRGFIQTALDRALRNILKDESEAVEPALDRDTLGEQGSPEIAQSIFAKITLSDVFVCDVSIVNANTLNRPTPNPNVLVELGYAVAQLGWQRVLLIQNTHFGGPESLPFDLRGRRIICYTQSETQTDRALERGALTGRLEAALKDAIGVSSQLTTHAGPDISIWWGEWNLPDEGGMNGGTLLIYEVGPAGFLFRFTTYNGSHAGSISGYAHIVASDLAYFRRRSEVGDLCEIVFRRRLSENTHIVDIGETGNCSYWRGMGALFNGTFIRKRDRLFDMGVLDELDLARLYRLLGHDNYTAFRLRMQGISELENIDTFIATGATGGVRGLYTAMEGIIMRGKNGELWVAFIHDDVVRYFTTEHDSKKILPKTIDEWRARFKEKTVTFEDVMSYIPRTL